MTIANNELFWQHLTIGILIGAFIIAIAPYLFRLFIPNQPPIQLPGSVSELVARYVYGTTAILLGGGLAVTLMGLWWVALVYLAIAVGCGVTVVLRYFSHDFANNKTQNAIQRNSNPNLKDD